MASLNIDTGGPAQSVSALADAQALAGLAVTIVTFDYERHGPLVVPKHAALITEKAGFIARNFRGWSLRFGAMVMQLAKTQDVIHSHGLWMQVNRHARIGAEECRKPLVISPRGMLEDYSLSRSMLRKRLAWHLYERRNLESAALIHATSEQEAMSIERILQGAKTVVVPNVVSHVDIPNPERGTRRRMLYLGRLDHKKGLDWLIQGWLALASTSQDWELVIAGPCAAGFENQHANLIRLGAGCGSITWHPTVRDRSKHELIASSDVLILPSRSENFGNVVIEALRHGKPVIATTATPWRLLEHSGSGWWVDASLDGVRNGLASALSASSAELDVMARNARIAATAFSDHAIGRTWSEIYSELVRDYA